jgi:hypothetical protein
VHRYYHFMGWQSRSRKVACINGKGRVGDDEEAPRSRAA